MSIKAVAFDIDGTLYDFKYLRRQFVKISRLHPFKMRKFFIARKNVRALLKKRSEEKISREEFLRLQTESVNKKSGYFDIIYTLLRKNRKFKIYDGVDEFLRLLKERGIKTATLSDFPVETKVDELGLSEHFDVMLSAEDCGFLKPDRKAFSYLLSKLSVKSDECIYIGDSYTKDKKGSEDFGMKGLLIGKDFHSYHELIDRIDDLLK